LILNINIGLRLNEKVKMSNTRASYTRELQALQLFLQQPRSESKLLLEKQEAKAMDIETAPANSKEEKNSDTQAEIKEYKETELDKKLVASSSEAFSAFCIAISHRGVKASLFLFLGIIPAGILIRNVLPFLALENDLKTCIALTRIEIPEKISPLQRPIGLFQEHLRLRQLLQHIAYNKLPEAEDLIKSNPKLLCMYGPIVKDYSGRKIQQYPYQMALMGRDRYVKFKDGRHQPDAKGKDMPTMVEHYFIKFFGEEKGGAEMERQGKMVSPDNFKQYIKQEQAKDLEAVTEMFNAIRDAEAIDEDGLAAECGEALKKFKKHLEPEGLITTTTPGYHFDPQVLCVAYNLYNANFITFGDKWDSAKNLFAWQIVIGLIQRYLTASDAMAQAQSLYWIVEKGEEFKRNLKFRFGDGVYYPLDFDPNWVLGKNCVRAGVLGMGWMLLEGKDIGRGYVRVWWAVLENTYVELKHRLYKTYAAGSLHSADESMFNNVVESDSSAIAIFRG
jgi:hypothetical protein